jgi:nucleotide-binding universal stress UspA family protein
MKVMIATDGSDFSRAAIENFCRTVVVPEDATIKIVTVYEKFASMAAEPFAISAEYYAAVEASARKGAELLVADAAEQIRKYLPNANIEIQKEILMGAPGKMIVESADEWGADLIVVGSHGYGFWSRTLLGSVSNSIVHNAPCSVLVVRRPGNLNGNKKQ